MERFSVPLKLKALIFQKKATLSLGTTLFSRLDLTRERAIPLGLPLR